MQFLNMSKSFQVSKIQLCSPFTMMHEAEEKSAVQVVHILMPANFFESPGQASAAPSLFSCKILPVCNVQNAHFQSLLDQLELYLRERLLKMRVLVYFSALRP